MDDERAGWLADVSQLRPMLDAGCPYSRKAWEEIMGPLGFLVHHCLLESGWIRFVLGGELVGNGPDVVKTSSLTRAVRDAVESDMFKRAVESIHKETDGVLYGVRGFSLLVREIFAECCKNGLPERPAALTPEGE